MHNTILIGHRFGIVVYVRVLVRNTNLRRQERNINYALQQMPGNFLLVLTNVSFDRYPKMHTNITT